MDTWRTQAPHILPPCVCQEGAVCWSVAFIHQFEAKLKLQELLPSHEHLSIQEFINILPRRFREEDGTLLGSEYAVNSLVRQGTVLDRVCPLTYDLYSPGPTARHPNVQRFVLQSMTPNYLNEYLYEYSEFGSDIFEDTLKELAKVAPVAVRIPMCESYSDAAGVGGIYHPSLEEIAIADQLGCGHFLLLLGTVTINGVSCWECQDSGGLNWGNGGNVYICRKHNLITEFIEMEV